jgi:hypothetical protein
MSLQLCGIRAPFDGVKSADDTAGVMASSFCAHVGNKVEGWLDLLV